MPVARGSHEASRLERHPHGDTFLYGIHQELSPEMTEAIVRRYRDAGWSHAVLRAGTAGAQLLILRP
jgi:hypothetical protein